MNLYTPDSCQTVYVNDDNDEPTALGLITFTANPSRHEW